MGSSRARCPGRADESRRRPAAETPPSCLGGVVRAAYRNRTDDLFITSESLWPTELRRQVPEGTDDEYTDPAGNLRTGAAEPPRTRRRPAAGPACAPSGLSTSSRPEGPSRRC